MTKQLPLACPCHEKADLAATGTGFACTKAGCIHQEPDHIFPFIDNIPILISESKCDTICKTDNIRSYINRSSGTLYRIKKWIFGGSRVTINNCRDFVHLAKELTQNPKILIIGSGEKGGGTEALWGDSTIEIHGIDIYASDSVDAICDAHYLPLESQSYDGVWIQAVLEHVVQPQRVAEEIYRVLKDDGIVYAETPFMQQVHEGAYDFTRFTVLGHRYLFKKFAAIKFGGNRGPDLVLSWAIRYFIWSLTRSRALSRIFGLTSELFLKPFIPLLSSRSMHDASSSVFFLGRKAQNHDLSHKDLISLYKGQF